MHGCYDLSAIYTRVLIAVHKRGGVLSIRGVTIRVLYVCASILVFTLLAVVVLGMTVAVPTADVRARQSVRGKDGGQLERQLRERVLL